MSLKKYGSPEKGVNPDDETLKKQAEIKEWTEKDSKELKREQEEK